MSWIATFLLTILSAATVPHSRYVLQCVSTPTIPDVVSYTRPGAIDWPMPGDINTCYPLGELGSTHWYACHGPTSVRDGFATRCVRAVPWSQARTLPSPIREFLEERSTVCGWSGGRRAWPGSDTATTASATQIDGYGPGVVAGTDPCEEYAQE